MALKIVSGGQTGVDRAALDVALAIGLPAGGWCPRGRRAEDGFVPGRYPLAETPSAAYAQRTLWNVRDSDGTLVLTRGEPRGGTALTLRLAERAGKPMLRADLRSPPAAAAVRRWLRAQRIRTLNVAGPRESGAPGISGQAARFLRLVLSPAAPRPRRPPRASAAVERRLLRIADRLAAVYGRPHRELRDPLDELVLTVLSQHTSDVNSERAFAALKACFPAWEAAAGAHPQALEDAIRVGGLARLKSHRILELLRAVRAREGRYDLTALRGLEAGAAEQRLSGLAGVGPKTRACVLLFACGQPAFPVDTHVHRIVRRLGLVPANAGAAKAQALLEPSVRGERALDLHLNLIRLGRELCRPVAPRCPLCPLRRSCAYGRSWRGALAPPMAVD